MVPATFPKTHQIQILNIKESKICTYHLLNIDTVPTTQMIYFYMVTGTLGSSVKKGPYLILILRGKTIFDSVPSDTEMYLPTYRCSQWQQYQCPECERVCQSRHDLDIHIRKHTGR